MGNLKSTINQRWVGFLLGILSPIVGYVFFSSYFCIRFDKSFKYVFTVFNDFAELQSRIISLSILFNLIAFYILINRNYMRAVQGVLIGTLVFAPFIIYLYFS